MDLKSRNDSLFYHVFLELSGGQKKMTEILEIEKEIFKYLKEGKSQKPAALLSNLLKSLDITQMDSFVDLLSRILKTEQGSKVSRKFIHLNRKIKDNNKLYDMELLFIKKHLLIDGERLIDSFFGTLESIFESVIGRIFLTNFRIIALGSITPKTLVPSSGTGNTMYSHHLVSMVARMAKDIKVAKDRAKSESLIRNEILKTMNFGFYSVNQIQFGSYYPVSNPSDIYQDTRSLKFSTTFSFMAEDERQFSKNNFQIYRMRLSNESHEEYQANLANTYDLIIKTFKNAVNVGKDISVIKMAQISDIGTPLGVFFKKNQGKAWTAKAILNRVDELDLTSDIRQKLTEKMIIEGLDRLYKEGFIGRDLHEDQFFYFL